MMKMNRCYSGQTDEMLDYCMADGWPVLRGTAG